VCGHVAVGPGGQLVPHEQVGGHITRLVVITDHGEYTSTIPVPYRCNPGGLVLRDSYSNTTGYRIERINDKTE
jgi:hypothetical protein